MRINLQHGVHHNFLKFFSLFHLINVLLLWCLWSSYVWGLASHESMSETYPTIYRKVASSRLSWLVAHFRIFRLFMKGKFHAYVLWPFGKKSSKLNSWQVYYFWLYGMYFSTEIATNIINHDTWLQLQTYIGLNKGLGPY